MMVQHLKKERYITVEVFSVMIILFNVILKESYNIHRQRIYRMSTLLKELST